jgi:hypothetical protein
MLAPIESAPHRPAPGALPLSEVSLGPVVMADDPCEAAFGGADPPGPRKYYRARYYDPSLGRFISEDRVGVEAASNLYWYADNRPTGLVDPDGHEAIFRFIDGSSKSASNSAQFAEIAKNAKCCSIDAVIVGGHANPNFQSFNFSETAEQGLYYDRKRGVVLVDDGNVVGSLHDLLDGKFYKNGSRLMTLLGCQVAAGDDTITGASSLALPGIRVMGSAGTTYSFNYTMFTVAPGGDRIYLNGQRIQ